jgi:dienelactone hydrolase
MKINKIIVIALTLFAISVLATAEDFSLSRNTVEVTGAEFEKFSVDADIYKPEGQKIIATLILYPTISGVSPLETITAKYFARNGFVVIVPLPFVGEIDKPNPDFKKLDTDFIRPSAAGLKLLEYSDRKFNLSETMPVFALGASQGGIRTVALTAFSGRIKAAWFAVAGGDFPYIYAHSQVEALVKFRSAAMKNLNLDSEDKFENYLHTHLSGANDPLIACSKISVPVVQVLATKDVKVPTHSQDELEKACPTHKVYKIPAGHVSGSISIILMKHKIKRFFLQNI